jgi:hypothetical protein
MRNDFTSVIAGEGSFLMLARAVHGFARQAPRQFACLTPMG